MPALYLDSRVGVEEYIVLSETMVKLSPGVCGLHGLWR